MSAYLRAATLCSVIVSTATLSGMAVAVAEDATKDAVVASWKARERHWAGKKITWTERKFVAAHSVRIPPKPDGDAAPDLFPDADIEVEGDAYLGLAASGFVIERMGLQFNADVQKFLHRPMRVAVTKDFAIDYRGLEAGAVATDSAYPFARRDRKLERSAANEANLAPILFFMPISYRIPKDKSLFQIEEATVTPDPKDESQVIAAYDVGKFGQVFYLDASSYLPLRYEVLSKAKVAEGVVSLRVRFDYADRKDPLSLPSSWEWAIFDREVADRVRSRVAAKSIATSSTNDCDPSALPVGTMIMEIDFDEAKRENKIAQYFVTPKGEYKLSEGERRLPYIRLVEWLRKNEAEKP